MTNVVVRSHTSVHCAVVFTTYNQRQPTSGGKSVSIKKASRLLFYAAHKTQYKFHITFGDVDHSIKPTGTKQLHRAGLSTVRTMRPHRTADSRGASFWDGKNFFFINYVCQFQQLWCVYSANADINNVELNWVCFTNKSIWVIKCIVNTLANILPENVVSPIEVLRYVHSKSCYYMF